MKITAGSRKNPKTFGLKNLISRILLSLLSVLVCLALTDIGLRIFTSISPRSGYFKPEVEPQEITERTTVFKSNYSGTHISRDFKVSIRINKQGFRERELDFSDLSSQQPYFFTGDSMLFGWGVETSARVTERFAGRLNAQGMPAPVVNFSSPGFGVYQYNDILKLYASKVKPRLAIVGFFVGNDFQDDFNALKRMHNSDTVSTSSFSAGLLVGAKNGIRRLLHDSPLVNLINYSLWDNKYFRDLFNRLEIKNDRLVLYEFKSSPRQEVLYRTTYDALDELAKISRENQIAVLVVIIPDHLQILARDIFAGVDFNKPQRLLKKRLDELGMAHLDLLDYFLKAPDPQSLFFREDKHWNEKGNDFVSGMLFDYVKQGAANK